MHTGVMSRDDFYEDDEPVGDVLAAFEAGEPTITARSAWGVDVKLGQKIRVAGLRLIERQGVSVTTRG